MEESAVVLSRGQERAVVALISHPSVVEAAKTILDFTLRTREQFEYLERIKALEAALKAREEAEQETGA